MQNGTCSVLRPVGSEIVTPTRLSHIQHIFSLLTVGIHYLTSEICKSISYRSNLRISKTDVLHTSSQSSVKQIVTDSLLCAGIFLGAGLQGQT